MERARLLMAIEPDQESKSVALISESDAAKERSEVMQLKTQLSELTEQVATLAAIQLSKRHSQPPRCFTFQGIGHVQQNCPNKWNHQQC